MLDWKVLAITVPLLFVSFQSLSKVLPKGVSPLLAAAYASIAGAVLLITLYLLTSSNKSMHIPAKYLYIALGMGVFISLGNFGIIKAYSLGAPQSTFTPLFYITLIVYGIIFGLIFWHEKLNLIQLGGIALSCVGIFLTVFFRK